MTGTLVNCAAVVAGGSIGILLKKGIKESYTESINKSLGLAIFIIGLNGVITNMFKSENGSLKSSGELLLVIFLILGTLLGELLRLDDRFTKFSNRFESKFKNGGFETVNGDRPAGWSIGKEAKFITDKTVKLPAEAVVLSFSGGIADLIDREEENRYPIQVYSA